MPTYVYRREDGSTFEITQRITDDPLTVDPETGQAVERMIGGGAGLIFKGSGFYLTDYARAGKGGEGAGKSGEGAGKSGEQAGKTSSAGASGSAEAKPAASGKTASSGGAE